MTRWIILSSGVLALACASTGGGREPSATAPPRSDARGEASTATAREAVATSGQRTGSGDAQRPAARAEGRRTAAPARGAAASADAAASHGKRFTLDGRIAGVGGTFSHSVKIDRSGDRPAQLRVDDGTKVLLDGREAKVGDLKEGDEVRATFELRNDTPYAVELRARTERR